MSQSFFIEVPQPPVVKELVESLGFADLQCLQLEEWPESPWPDEVWHFARKDLSSRGVELGLAEQSLQVRLAAFFTGEDLELALRFMEAFAAPEALVETEDGEKVPAAKLRERLGADWRRACDAAAVDGLVQAFTAKADTVVEVGGFRRALYVGQRYFEELRAAGPEEALAARIADALRRLEWLEAYPLAPTLEVPSRGGPPILFARWFANTPCLLSPVFFVAVQETADQHFFVPFKQMAGIAGARCKLIDEVQYLVDAVPEAEWPAQLEHARAFQAKPDGDETQAPAGPRWWQFWK